MKPGKRTRDEDHETLSRSKVKKLRGKVLGLTTSSQHLRRKLKDMNNQAFMFKSKLSALQCSFERQQRELEDMSEELRISKAMNEELTKCNVGKDKDIELYKDLLKLRTEDLFKAESECSKLQQDCLGNRKTPAAVKAAMKCPLLQQNRFTYRKKLAAVKSAPDINLDDRVKSASLGNADNSKVTVGLSKTLPRKSSQRQPSRAGGRGKALRFTKRTYLKAVEDKFQGNKKKYYEIIKVIKDMEANKIEISDARSRVKDLCKGHQELVSGFDRFIAQNFKSQLLTNDRVFRFKIFKTRLQTDEDDCVFKLFLDLEQMYQRKSMSKTEFHYEAAILLRRHPDLLNDFIQFSPDNDLPTNAKLFNSTSIRKPETEMFLSSRYCFRQ